MDPKMPTIWNSCSRSGSRSASASSAKLTQRSLSGSRSGSVRVPPQGMRGMRQNGGTRLAASLIAGGSLLLSFAGCGSGDKFKNEPRPPVATQLTGVIRDDEVTVSPNALPLPAEAGQQVSRTELDTPIILIISNET